MYSLVEALMGSARTRSTDGQLLDALFGRLCSSADGY